MDAKYLNDNVNFALTEALSSMAVALPEDGVEYIGKYLLQFVERKNMKDLIVRQNQDIEARAVEQTNIDADIEAKEAVVASATEEYKQELKSFTDSLAGLSSNKQDVMDRSTAFLAEYLKIPAAYVAIKKTLGEVETLNYFSANAGQEHIVGSKIIKVPEDAEEVEARSGLSFEAFKLPEVPEETEEEELPEGEVPPPKVIPQPQPLSVDNVMRNPRVKFFGVPKLGAFVAVPLSFKSIDHETGCEIKNDDDGVPFYAENPVEVPLIISVDTIGKYRRFKAEEIDIVKTVGDAMVNAFATMERKMYSSQVSCMEALKPVTSSVGETLEALRQNEETVGTSAVENLDEEVKAEQGPMKEAIARAQFWTQKLINAPFRTYFRALQDHTLPAPLAVATLFFATGCLLGIAPTEMKDACEDINWDSIKKTTLISLCSDAFTFAVEAKSEVCKECSVANIRAVCEAANLFDASVYPGNMQGVVVLSIWLQKNLTARENAIAYYREVKNEEIEVVK